MVFKLRVKSDVNRKLQKDKRCVCMCVCASSLDIFVKKLGYVYFSENLSFKIVPSYEIKNLYINIHDIL